MKTWTIRFSLIGLVIGIILSTQADEYLGFETIDDFLYTLLISAPFLMMGFDFLYTLSRSAPFLMMGFLLGLCTDIFSISGKNKSLAKTTTANSLKSDEEKENKELKHFVIQEKANVSNYQSVKDNSLSIDELENDFLTVINKNTEEVWELIANEYDGDKRKKGLYAKLFTETNGDENKIRAMYYKQRINELVK